MKIKEGDVMDIQKEREAFEAIYKPCDRIAFCFGLKKYVQLSREDNDSEIVDHANLCWELWQAAKADAVPEGFVVCKSEPVAYIVQNKFWKQKFDVKSVKDMPPQKWEDDHYDVEIPLYAVSLDGLVLKEQDEDEAND